MNRKKYIPWGITVGIATLIVLADVGQDYVEISMHNNSPPSISRLVLWASIWWYTWAFFAVGVYKLTSRYLITKERWKSALLIHVAGCFVAYVAHVSVQVAMMALPVYTPLHPTWEHAISHHAGTSIFLNIVIYWSIVGASHAIIYYSHFKRREVTTARLETDLQKAQLNTLKMQIQPHFLFNTLNAISALIHKEPSEADQMIAKLGELLRRTIDLTDINEVPLLEEIDFLKKYLDIEQARFENQLEVNYTISSTVENAAVPNLILQPVVENAIKHGISRIRTTGVIDIHAFLENEHLILKVVDNGPGLISPDALEQGTGITNTKARLNKLFGDQFSFTFEEQHPSGLKVTIRLPFKEYEPVELDTSLHYADKA